MCVMSTEPTGREPWMELRVIREKDGHTLASLARAVTMPNGNPMSLSYLSDLEKGRQDPGPAITKLLAVTLNVPVSVLEKHRRIEGDAA